MAVRTSKSSKTAAASAAVVLAFVMGLAGCMTTPVTSLPALARIDFETTDVSELAVAVRVPQAVQSAPEGAVLMMTISDPENPDASQTGRFLLEATQAAKTDGFLISQRQPGARVMSYRLKREDISRFRALRALRFTADGHRRQGYLSAMPRLCRTANWRADSMPVSVYLRTSETGRFVTVVRNQDLRGDLTPQTLDVILPICGKGQARLSARY